MRFTFAAALAVLALAMLIGQGGKAVAQIPGGSAKIKVYVCPTGTARAGRTVKNLAKCGKKLPRH
jgi:hypothetical protein